MTPHAQNTSRAYAQTTANEPPELRVLRWLVAALETSGMQKAELARRLAAELNRPIERGTVGALVTGARKLKADEMLAIASICRVPLPQIGLRETRSKRRASASTPDLFPEHAA